MDDMYAQCCQYMNRRVRIQTHYGNYEGTVVGVDGDNVYLQTGDAFIASKARTSAWGFSPFGFGGFGFGSSILALSLFTLLAIALI